MDADVDVGFATAGLELKEIGDKVQQWKEYGDVSDDDMLATMTVNTATILGVGQTLGNLNNGQVASFSVMTKPFTDKETKTLYSVSAGELNELEN
jgi:N-acetylglucosamine-6-phosphate deacetylase